MIPRVAIAILNWNGEQLLRHYLPIVIANSQHPDAEIVVVDNHSTDASIALLKDEFPSVRIVALDENYGFAGGYNKALFQLENEFVVLLNSDVAPREGWLQPLIDVMDSDSSIAVCAPKILDDKNRTLFEYAGAAGGYIDYLGYPYCRGRVMDTIEADNGQYDDDADALWVSGAAFMVRRNDYLGCGGLDEDFFAHMEEIDLCWRLRNAGKRIVACGQSSVYHLGGATLNTMNPHKTFLNFRNNLAMIVKNYNLKIWPLVILFRLFLDGVAGMRYVFMGQFSFCWAIVRAHFAFYANMNATLKKRKACRQRIVEKDLLPEIGRFSLIFRYYIQRKRLFSELD